MIYLDESIQFGTINQDDRLDHNGSTFLQENTRHPATFAGSSRPSLMLYKREEAERVKVVANKKILTKKKTKVVSKKVEAKVATK